MKPDKPYPGFPLYAHRNGQWAKKILGRTHYFGPWADWQAALKEYTQHRDSLHSGLSFADNRLTLGEAADLFLSSKDAQVEAGSITKRTYQDYDETCTILVHHLGALRPVESLTAADFDGLNIELSKRFSRGRLKREVAQVKMIFRFLEKTGAVDQVRMGSFQGPSKREDRLYRSQQVNIFTADEVDALINAADHNLAAMILLGINCGFGNHDCGQLRQRDLDLDGGWHNMPRPKTGVVRRAKLWDQTVEAIYDALERRPESPLGDLVFVTKYRKPWFKDDRSNPIAHKFRKLMKEVGVYRQGRGFYCLRHTFATVAGECRDQVAVDYVMGHSKFDMPSNYRQEISDERLALVSEHVVAWLPKASKRASDV